MIWLAILFLYPYLILRIIFISASRVMSLARLETIRALIYGIEAFTALIMVILGYGVHSEVLPSAEYF